jgi:glycosyltransferase involved in cell wall biosynthesis
VIIQVSRIEECKGHDIHLQALTMLQDMPQWICWLVGGAQRPHDKKYLAELKETASRLGIGSRLRFLGERLDVPKLLAAADIYCQPNSHPETFGITFVEALYAKKPVITTSLGGAREIVNQSCGFLVAPNDARAVAEALRRLIENSPLRHKMGKAGSERAQALCNVAAQMRQLEDCFNRVKNDYCKKPSASLYPT